MLALYHGDVAPFTNSGDIGEPITGYGKPMAVSQESAISLQNPRTPDLVKTSNMAYNNMKHLKPKYT